MASEPTVLHPRWTTWVLENLVEGTVVNRIVVGEDDTHWAKVALQRMLDITEAVPKD